MAVIGFKERITDLSGSLGTADDNALQQWLIDGCYDVIANVGISHKFAIDSSSYSSSMTVNLDDVREIIGVQRNSILCKRVPYSIAQYVDPNTTLGADSIHRATSISPVFYEYSNQLIVKPNPTSTEQGNYSYIPDYSISDFTSTSASVDNFPKQYDEHIILYTAIKVLDRQLLDLVTNTDINTAITAAKDAITKSSAYMDSTGATTINVVGWLNDEDSEMAQSVLRAVSAELSTSQASAGEVKLRMERDLQKYQWQQERRDNLKREYLSKFPQQGNKGGK